MRKTPLLLLSLSLLSACAGEQELRDEATRREATLATPLPRLRVSANSRYLVKDDGSPFFYLGDTAWELFHRLNRSEAVTYLQKRADQGFTVVQAVAVAELDGVNTPNAHGDKPFTNNNPATPATTPGADPGDATQYDYWDHVDFIVSEAESRGIYTALLPTWGSHVLNGTLNTSNAQAYGQFLGSRYAGKPIIWVLGGDRSPAGYEAVWRALAKGIALGVSGTEDYAQLLMTYHPPGAATSSTWFHNEPWLDFNMRQNGHCANTDVWNLNASDLALSPSKPVLDGEPLYEQHPICFNAPTHGYSNDYEIRKYAYWDVFAGAFGHTYGHHSVWQMYAPGRSPVNGPQNYWSEALLQPGASQMKFLRRLIESRPLLVRIPDQTVLSTSAGSGTARIQATRGSDGGYAFVYSASGQSFGVNMNKLSGGTVRASWYDPRNGTSTLVGTFPNTGTRQFTPPGSGAGQDWVLVLDDASRGFPLPGEVVTQPPPNGSFYRAINLNGAATVIDGRNWEGGDAPNYTFTGTAFANPAVTLNPATDANRAAMIRSSIWSTSAAVRLHAMPSGSYTVYLYTWEDNDPETFSVYLEGSLVKANHDSGPAGTWARLGPWTVTVTDGTLDLTTSGGAANLSGIEVLGAGGGGNTFVRGVNFNGSAVTIDGQAWQSYSTALANGLGVNAPNLTTTTVTPVPATDSGTSAMLNSAIWKMNSDLLVSQSIANGDYSVSLWIMENYQSNSRSFRIRLEGTEVESAAGSLPLGGWKKYGPYPVTVGDGALNVDLVRVSGDPHLMGMAIFK
ncbi:hypothetical protein D187_004781 [Cystobacter fuscus DSM 2262]|uniref:DUF4038 domain-containing protein n=1 Tax=Cystobacter fuscus (strain ATCC 25194 / DSM 2262 / NBRC 100088 / M29) TaxID=1242864 RepID=S9P602_CYSF2|nr:glycoside hydrolase family 140 protein [Cystobacter fuscus]EPX57642.1 hypothetical protein D187_004781 [Cystobacter fuscus DSM 2262]